MTDNDDEQPTGMDGEINTTAAVPVSPRTVAAERYSEPPPRSFLMSGMAVENANTFNCQHVGRCCAPPGRNRAGTLTTMRMADADDLVAVDVFNAAQAAGEPVTTALVRRVVDDLLTHPPECGCGRCEAASTARVGDVRNIASSWQRAVAATKTTRNPPNRQRVGSGPDWHIPRLAASRLTISSNCLSANVVRH